MEFRKMLTITVYAEQKKRHRCIEQSFRLCGRRRGWDVSREQHLPNPLPGEPHSKHNWDRYVSLPLHHLWVKARVECFKRIASKHVYHLGWNRSPAQVGCMWQAFPGALGKPRGSGWRGRWEGESGWGTHVNPWLFHFNVWQNPLQIQK